jgi:hypothetical protein
VEVEISKVERVLKVRRSKEVRLARLYGAFSVWGPEERLDENPMKRTYHCEN